MKKLKLGLIILLSMILSACSFLEEVNTSLDYVNITTEHLNNLNIFAEEAPQLIENALNNPEVHKELENKMTSIKQEIEEFIALNDIPTIATEIHAELVNKNELLLEEINKLLDNGQLVLDQMESSQLFTTINDVTVLINRIENLTQ